MIIAVGSNIDPDVHVPAAIANLRQLFAPIETSPFYVTSAIERPEQPDYWNGVVACETSWSKDEVIRALRKLEADAGRVRGPDKWAARELDLDVLEWDGVWADDIWHRPFLAQAVADVGIKPPVDVAPDPKWPVAWKAHP